MTEPLILTMLRAKQADVEQHIDGLNAGLANSRRDLLHLAATIKLSIPPLPMTHPLSATTAAPRP